MNIDQLKAAALKATPGPWTVQAYGDDWQIYGGKSGMVDIADVCPSVEEDEYLANAQHIAAASPDVILALIQKYEEATKWTPVEQGLPPAGKVVQVVVGDYVRSGWLRDFTHHKRKVAAWRIGTGTTDAVTHWAPMLTPPASPEEDA